MKTQFRGRFEIKLDPKYRLTLPMPLRQLLQSIEDNRVVITNSQFQGRRCLDAYPLKEWEALEAKISRLPQLKVEVQNFQRFYLSGGHVAEMDAQGRVLVPPSLRQYAQLQTDIVIVGMNEKFEIWDVGTWNGLFENLSQEFPNILSDVAGLEVSCA